MPETRKGGGGPGVVLGVLSLAAFMASLDLFIVNVAFRDIGESFPDQPLADQSWVLNAYAIVYAALLIPIGRYADQHSRKTGFLFGVALFTVASLACAVAPSLWTLVAARVLQAIGAAALTPTSLGLLVAAFDGPGRARAVRIWAATGAIAAASGPVVGGVLVELSWRWVFLVNIPIGIGAFVVAARVVQDSSETEKTGTPDPAGATLVIVAIGALALALVKGQEWGWGGPDTLAAFAVALVGAAILGRRMATHPRPLVEPAMLAVRTFRWSTISAIGFGAAFAGFLLTGVLFAQEVWNYGPITVGLAVAPGPLMVPIFAVVGSRLRTRLSAGTVVALGCAVFAAGCVLTLSSITIGSDYAARLLPGLLLSGVGTGLALPEILATATSELPPDRSTTGSAIVNAARQIGSVIGVSAVIALLPTIGDLDPLDGFRHALWACVALALVGGLTGLRIGRPNPTPSQPSR
ncbi:MFS transporter [Patulibacter sp.]|uniref:MFS transporter n=1 Tax=Patulibacter sp. TaxID=1912859 RepID=UPI002719732C|nr:MFS transporter [Patulibacter sp.]MDO9408990.1 MFS transporter [Patulibacter sp.]